MPRAPSPLLAGKNQLGTLKYAWFVNRSQVAERNDAGTAYFEKQNCPVTELSVFGAIMLETLQTSICQIPNEGRCLVVCHFRNHAEQSGIRRLKMQRRPERRLNCDGAFLLEESQVPNSQVTNSETLQVLSGLDPINCIQQSTVYPLNNSDRMLWVNDRFCRSSAADGENFPLDFLH